MSCENNKIVVNYNNVIKEYIEYIGIKDYISIVDYGAIGDGVTDNSTALLDALEDSKQDKKLLYIPEGEFLVVHGLGTIDASGNIGIFGTGTLIFDTIEEDIPLIHWRGEKELSGEGQTVVKGGREAIINTGLDIANGDTIYLVSNETSFNLPESRKRGQRLTVFNYNTITGEVVFVESFLQDITYAYFYWNKERPKIIIDGVTIRAKENTFRKGLEFVYSDVIIRDLTMIGFSKFCVNISQSQAYIENYRARDFYSSGSTTSYGLQVSGLSRVYGTNLDLVGGRHAITHGDVGEWSGIEVGGDANLIFFSGEGKYVDSHFQSDMEIAFDAHGNTHKVEVYNSTIIGGVGVGSTESIFSNCKIVYNSITAILSIILGRDSEDISIPRGSHTFVNCEIVGGSNLASIISSLELLAFKKSDIEIRSVSTNYNAIAYMLGLTTINSFTLENTKIKATNILGSRFINLKTSGENKINNVSFDNIGLNILHDFDEHKDIHVSNVTFSGVGIQRLFIAKETEHIPTFDLYLNNVLGSDSSNELVYVIRARDLYIDNSFIFSSGTFGLRTINLENIYISNSKINSIRFDFGNYLFTNVTYSTFNQGTSSGQIIGGYSGSNVDFIFSKPIQIPQAVLNNQAVNLGQINNAIGDAKLIAGDNIQISPANVISATLTWNSIEGNQEEINLSGFNNDGDGTNDFITIEDIPEIESSDSTIRINGNDIGLNVGSFTELFYIPSNFTLPITITTQEIYTSFDFIAFNGIKIEKFFYTVIAENEIRIDSLSESILSLFLNHDSNNIISITGSFLVETS